MIFAATCVLLECILSHHATLPLWLCLNMGIAIDSPQFDGVWATLGVSLQHALMCMVQHSPGDHRALIIDVHYLDTMASPNLWWHTLQWDGHPVKFPQPLIAIWKCLIHTVNITNWAKTHCAFLHDPGRSSWPTTVPRWNGEIWQG